MISPTYLHAQEVSWRAGRRTCRKSEYLFDLKMPRVCIPSCSVADDIGRDAMVYHFTQHYAPWHGARFNIATKFPLARIKIRLRWAMSILKTAAHWQVLHYTLESSIEYSGA